LVGLELPKRRLGRVLAAQLAGAKDRFAEHGDATVPARAAGCGDARPVGHQDADVANEALAQIVRELDVFGEIGGAVQFDQADVARGRDHTVALIVADCIGQQGASVLIDLHVAAGGHDAQLLVVGHLVGAEEDGFFLQLLRNGCFALLGEQRRSAKQDSQARDDQGDEENQQSDASTRGLCWSLGAAAHSDP